MSNLFLPPGISIGPEYATPEWFEFRRGLVTASRFGDVMTEPKSLPAEVVSKYSHLVIGQDRYTITKTGKNAGQQRQVEGWSAMVKEAMESERVYHWGDTARGYLLELISATITEQDKVGGSSAAMERGKDLESDAIDRYAATKFVDVSNGLILHKEGTLIAATPDGFIEDDEEGPGMIEVKCPDAKNHLDTFLSRTLPEQYIEQVQGQLWISGRQWCDFISYDDRFPGPMQLVVIRIRPDMDLLERMAPRIHVFAQEVEAKVNTIRAYLAECSMEQRQHVHDALNQAAEEIPFGYDPGEDGSEL